MNISEQIAHFEKQFTENFGRTLRQGALFSQPKVEFSAVGSARLCLGNAAPVEYRFTYAFSRGRECWQYQTPRITVIARHDKGVAWMLFPDTQEYQEMAIPREGSPAKHDDAHAEAEEHVAGLLAKRFSMRVAAGPNTPAIDSRYWLSEHGIALRTEGTVAMPGSAVVTFEHGFESVKIAAQPAQLFEIPATYREKGSEPSQKAKTDTYRVADLQAQTAIQKGRIRG